jgi:hypothetical protein
MCTEVELKEFFNDFFHGLDAGLKSLKEIRAVYDERVAFDFSSVRFFWPNENKISEILAFFLDPNKNHGQKLAFLRAFLEHVNLPDAIELLDKKKKVSVILEDSTEEKRRIDITVKIGDDFTFAIENKIYDWTQDQDKQLEAYDRHLNETGKKYVLYYLTPNGHEPPTTSIDKELLQKRKDSGNFKCISYSGDRGIIEVLSKFELVCRADNVRAFIKDFQQYLKWQYTGEVTMDEQKFVNEYVEKNPQIIKYINALQQSAEAIRTQRFDLFWSKVAEFAKNDHRKIQIEKFMWDRDSGTYSANVKYDSSFFSDSTDCDWYLVITFEKNNPDPICIGIGLRKERKNLSTVEAKLERLEASLKKADYKLAQGWSKDWRCGFVSLPCSQLWEDEYICKLDSQTEDLFNKEASKSVEMISKYIDLAEFA